MFHAAAVAIAIGFMLFLCDCCKKGQPCCTTTPLRLYLTFTRIVRCVQIPVGTTLTIDWRPVMPTPFALYAGWYGTKTVSGNTIEIFLYCDSSAGSPGCFRLFVQVTGTCGGGPTACYSFAVNYSTACVATSFVDDFGVTRYTVTVQTCSPFELDITDLVFAPDPISGLPECCTCELFPFSNLGFADVAITG